MVRPSLTRLIDSAARAVLLIPCLLICLACATPFPLENLEEGMTTGTVWENFGEPEAISWPGRAESSWSYVHEERDWFIVIRKPVVLHFESEKLVGWEVLEPTPAVSSGSNWDTDEMQWDWDKDSAHHEAEKKALKQHQTKEKKLLSEHQKEEGTSKAHRKAEKKALKQHQKKERRWLEKHGHC